MNKSVEVSDFAFSSIGGGQFHICANSKEDLGILKECLNNIASRDAIPHQAYRAKTEEPQQPPRPKNTITPRPPDDNRSSNLTPIRRAILPYLR